MRVNSLAVVFSILFVGTVFLKGATLVVENHVSAPAPAVIAYNLGNFFPESNTTGWWDYSRISGARFFLNAAHFNVSGTARPGEESIVDLESFNARRALLRSDPTNIDYINWPRIEERFNTRLGGRNRIIPQYALSQIYQRGGIIKAQTTVGEGSFPIEDDDDWHGKWILWRTYYSVAFYLAQHFDVERFASHNEPNHPGSFIEPESWLMRLRLASDAARSALEDVNRIYGKSLDLKFKAPVTAGATSTPFDLYGEPAIQSIRINYEGDFREDETIFQHYAYQRYNLSAQAFASDFLNLKGQVQAATPVDIPALKFALTEFNVHTGLTYDSIPESSHTLEKALRFGAISTSLTNAGLDELYAFKFGMTPYEGNFPVQKNGMLFSDNSNEPYNYGSMSLSAEVFRLFNKAVSPGRVLLAHSLTGTGSSNLTTIVGKDPQNHLVHVFSVNESSQSVPMEIDLSAFNLSDGSIAIIEDVSQWRSGTIRSLETINNGILAPGNQPARTVWLVSIPTAGQHPAGDDSFLLPIPLKQASMVRDGVHASTNYNTETELVVRNSPDSADDRSVVFLQFQLPEQLDPNDILAAVLSLPISPHQNVNESAVYAQLYGLDRHDWNTASLTWETAPNLRQGVSAGSEIRHGVAEGAGYSAQILGQLRMTDSVSRMVDVSDYLKSQKGGQASFLITQDPRWDLDINVEEIPEDWSDLVVGDNQPHGLRIHIGSAGNGPELFLVLRERPTLSFDDWVERSFEPATLVEEPFAFPDAPLAGSGGWTRGLSSPASDNPSDHIIVSNETVFFDWTTSEPLNNVVRYLWDEAFRIDNQWIYASFDFRVTTNPMDNSNLRPGFLSFGNQGGTQQRGFVGLRRGTTPETIQLGISSDSQLGTNFSFAAMELFPSVTYRVTIGLHAGTQETALWIDSEFQNDPPLLVQSSSGSNDGIQRINLRIFNSDGNQGTTHLGQFQLDNLSIQSRNPAFNNRLFDPFGAGIPNIITYAFGLKPETNAHRALPRIIQPDGSGVYFEFSKMRNTQDVEVILETSSDLIHWSEETNLHISSDFGYGQMFRFPLQNTTTSPPLFLRLRVEYIDP